MKPIVFDFKNVVCDESGCVATLKVDYEYWHLELREIKMMMHELRVASKEIEKVELLGHVAMIEGD